MRIRFFIRDSLIPVERGKHTDLNEHRQEEGQKAHHRYRLPYCSDRPFASLLSAYRIPILSKWYSSDNASLRHGPRRFPEEVKISGVDKGPERLSQDKYRIFSVDGINKKGETSRNAQPPKDLGNNASFFTFTDYPLD